jgi:predicted Rossmann-fold nucleotide-binding protein
MISSVIGGGDNPPVETLRMVEEVGRELARRGIAVACGGLAE